MAVYDWVALTWPEVRDLAQAGAVAILPVGAIEAHGPHLPLGTDLIIAGAMARDGAARLDRHGIDAIVLPPFTYTPAPFAAAFAGTVSTPIVANTQILVAIARSVAQHGFRALALANAHFDPANIECLREAVETARAQGEQVIFPDVTRRDLAERLTPEFQSGACHAGRYEGSVVLAERPELVKNELRQSLSPNDVSLLDAIRTGHATFADAGGHEAYFGAPAAATPEEGHETVATLGAILAEAIMDALA